MDEEERMPYTEQAALDVVRYERQKDEYLKTGHYD